MGGGGDRKFCKALVPGLPLLVLPTLLHYILEEEA